MGDNSQNMTAATKQIDDVGLHQNSLGGCLRKLDGGKYAPRLPAAGTAGGIHTAEPSWINAEYTPA